MAVPEIIDPNKIKSTVGAGDCFLGGYVAGMLKGLNDQMSIEVG